jgi:hypothetical protein
MIFHRNYSETQGARAGEVRFEGDKVFSTMRMALSDAEPIYVSVKLEAAS